VGTLDKIQNVANIIKEIKDQGHDIIAVVSAMSGETNKLMEYSSYFTTQPKKNELDVLLSSGERITSSLLSIALNTQGYQTISMSGRQAGIFTNENHTRARIDNIDIKNIKKEIDNNNIIIVAGFQGITKNGRVSTLGRGGSDLSAVAIAGAIKADICEIYTDVDGIYTTDPRIEPKAKKLDKISYDEMLELSSLGAKVLQNRSVELAKKLNVNLVSRSSFDTKISGTLITKEENIMEKPLVSGIALDRNQVRVGMYGVIDKPGIAASIFSALANEDINVDMIVQTVGVNNITDLDFTVPRTQLEITKKIMEEFKSYTKNIDYNEEVSKVSIVGVGMKSHVGIASKAFQALANENINIRIISTSEIKISMIILEKYSELAVRALHEVYNLDR